MERLTAQSWSRQTAPIRTRLQLAIAARTAFTFTVSDGHGGTDTATMNVIIDPTVGPGGNLLANGGFEDTTGMTAASNGWVNTSGALAGWTDVNGHQVEIHTDTENKVAPIGTGYFDLDGGGNNSKIAQTVDGIEAGRNLSA